MNIFGENDSYMIQTDCPLDTFRKAVDFVRCVKDYDGYTLLEVLKVTGYNAEFFEPDNITGTFSF
jgi:hypothetical protein